MSQGSRVSVEMGAKSENVGNFELSQNLGGRGLATLSFDRYKIAQTLQGRSCILCFETVLGMNKITPTTSLLPTPPSPKKLKNFQNFFKNLMLF